MHSLVCRAMGSHISQQRVEALAGSDQATVVS